MISRCLLLKGFVKLGSYKIGFSFFLRINLIRIFKTVDVHSLMLRYIYIFLIFVYFSPTTTPMSKLSSSSYFRSRRNYIYQTKFFLKCISCLNSSYFGFLGFICSSYDCLLFVSVNSSILLASLFPDQPSV